MSSGGGYKLNWIPAGHAEYTSLGTAIGLSTTAPAAGIKSNACPSSVYIPVVGAAFNVCARHAIISVEVQPVRITTDGTTPTAALGRLCPIGEPQIFEDALDAINALKVIETVAGAKISVDYYL